ncbi:MAG: hypothetical protein OT477_12065 [Chloroflexi bacterium]|nr:hypothetical protein [Chloroflexota bacterium]
MTQLTIVLNGKTHKLDQADLLQAGGEGMVFALGDDRAVKVYHQTTAAQQQKLAQFVGVSMAGRLPAAVIAPQELIYNPQGEIIGFTMRRMAAEAQPFKKLANPQYDRQHKLGIPQLVAYLQDIHTTLNALHQQGIVVGDLNDHNLFFLPQNSQPPHTAWIDVDSYQWGGYPCPVALQTFLDPYLYPITDFGEQPVFSEGSDWYAFFVLLVKTLLLTHPYGGTHHSHKSLTARAENKITLLHGAVVYPKQARPPEILSDELLAHFQRVFGRGERPPFPPRLLADYAQSLIECPQCGLHYPAQRPNCPTCRQQTFVPQPSQRAGTLKFRLLLETPGHIVQIWLKPENNYGSHNRFHALVQHNNLYSLIYAGMNGVIDEMPLFTGEPGYRFGLFGHHLVVNPPQRPHLLILDVSGQEPHMAGMVETAAFEGTAVFATTPSYLYRIASGYILRGQMQDGKLAEEMIGTAHRQQTQLWGSMHNDTLAGLHRILGDYRFFVRQPQGETAEFALPLATGESVQEMGVSFNGDGKSAALMLHTRLHHQMNYWQFAADQPPIALPPFGATPATLQTATLIPTDQGILKHKGHIQTLVAEAADYTSASDLILPHPRGLLIQQSQRLYLAEG